jgi:hypothetical protein
MFVVGRFRIILLFLTVCLVAGTACGACGSNLVNRPRQALMKLPSLADMPPIDRDFAEQLEILPLLTELHDRHTSLDRRLALRRDIAETVLECHFDALSVQAEAQRERAELEFIREQLVSRRDKNLEVNNATNFIASGTLNTIGSVLGFSPNTPPLSGNLNQMLSGVVSTGMSTYALKQSKGSKTKGQRTPTLIAELFGRPCDARSTYPESVWRYFNGPSPDVPNRTRVQALEDRWILRKHLEPHGSKREKEKLDIVSGLHDKWASIDDLSDEIIMLSDIANMASLMSGKLRDFLLLIDSNALPPQLTEPQ